MMNNNYKIFGLIVSLMRNDNPPEISKDFSENVMQKILLKICRKQIWFQFHL